MIFVTVGNDFRGFDRLLRKMDEIVPSISGKVIVQRGYSKYRPKNTEYFDFVPMSTAVEYLKNSELVVSHAGIGTIILCREYGIPIVIIPRRKKYGEHMNDHQMEIAAALEERKAEDIYVVYEVDHLEEQIAEALKNKERHAPVDPVGKRNLIKTIKAFIETERS